MREILGNSDCVLFDFDGPLCHLFATRSAASIAQRLRDLVEEWGRPVAPLPAELRESSDPHAVLRGIVRRRPGPRIVRRLEQALTHEEVLAASSAEPTDHSGELVTALVARGRRVAVVTNNSALAVAGYLSNHGLAEHFGGHIHGRTQDVTLLKPHPDALLRALDSTQSPPARALMIGDAPTDLAAARAAGVAFVGYAPDAARAAGLRRAGAPLVTQSLREVVRALHALAGDTADGEAR